MAFTFHRRFLILLYLPAVCFSVMPMSAPLRFSILSGAMALFSMALIGLCIYDVLRPIPTRPAIPLVWLLLAAGFGCLGAMLWLMARTWGQRLGHLPIPETDALLIIGGTFLVSGAVGFYHACIRRGELLQECI